MGMTWPARLTTTSLSFLLLYQALRPIATHTSAKYGTPFFVNWRSFDSVACFSLSCGLVVFPQPVSNILQSNIVASKILLFEGFEGREER